ncbi:MAG: cyclic nucleotide-binding domain-containing protein [Gammaproteobacteria bacterium]
MPESLATQAFIFGLFSAASLPLGALFAFLWSPGNKVVAAMMAFGSGALLAALTIDLVGEALERGDFVPLSIGCLIGGMLFVTINQWLNTRGGFLRKVGTTITHLRRTRSRDYKRVFKRLSLSPLFNALPPEQIQHLVPLIDRKTFKAGQILMKQGEAGDSVYIIDKGRVEIDDEERHHQVAELGANDVVGEIALLTGETRTATVKALEDVSVWVIRKEEFDELLEHIPEFATAIMALSNNRITQLKDDEALDENQADRWFREVKYRIDDAITAPTALDIREAATTIRAAPLAIWLGIFLDGIPESVVIGSSMFHASISLSLIAGLFLSNFPESFSASLGMREQNYSFTKILSMWTSLMLFTGIGAWLGAIFFVGASPSAYSMVQGIAAGAMLTVIAETMLPEAHHRGGGVTGMATLLGFLAAIFFTTLE